MNYIIGFVIGCIFTSISMSRFASKFAVMVMDKTFKYIEKEDEKQLNTLREALKRNK